MKKRVENFKNSDLSVIVFHDGELQLDVSVCPEENTVWLNRMQISMLFDRDIKTIGRHINTIFQEKELDKEAVVAKYATAAADGKTYQVDNYNLAVIISVGYRVKSQRGMEFRKWANGILKDYMVQGYAGNEKRLQYLNKTIRLQSGIIAGIAGIDADSVLQVVEEYTAALKWMCSEWKKSLEKLPVYWRLYIRMYSARRFIQHWKKRRQTFYIFLLRTIRSLMANE